MRILIAEDDQVLADGLLWLDAFERAVAQAESEFRAAVGHDVATVVALGLEAYGGAGH